MQHAVEINPPLPGWELLYDMESEAARLQNNPQVDFTPLEEPPPVCLIPAPAHLRLLIGSRFMQQLPP